MCVTVRSQPISSATKWPKNYHSFEENRRQREKVTICFDFIHLTRLEQLSPSLPVKKAILTAAVTTLI